MKRITRLEARALLSIAIPMVLSNITIPLLGLVDTAVIAHLPEAWYLGGVAVGSMIITLFLWLAGFLRMSTTGLTAQAFGARSDEAVQIVLFRGLLVAWFLGLVLILLQKPMVSAGLWFAAPGEQVALYANEYARIRVWSFPAALSNLVLVGWFLGVHRAKTVMWLLIFTNLINIVLDLVLVVGLKLHVAGVAWATVIAEYSAMVLGLGLAFRHLKLQSVLAGIGRILYWPELKKYLLLNSDILIRTLCLELCFAFVTFQGARLGDTALAANAILLNFLMLISFGLDGIAYAAEARVGRFKGAGHVNRLRRSVRVALAMTLSLALVYSLAFLGFGSQIIGVISSLDEVNRFAGQYLGWIVLLPLLACWCFLYDGVFIGLTRGRDMRNSMIVSTFLGFFPVWWMLRDYDNHALWAALSALMILRGITLGWRYIRMTGPQLLA